MRLRILTSDNSYALYTLDTNCVVSGDVVSSTFPNIRKTAEKELNFWNQDYGIGQKESAAVTKSGIKFFCMKTAQYSKKHDKLQSIGNKEIKLLFFLIYLSPVKQKKEIWNTFLIMKTKFVIFIYQNIILSV